MEFVVAGLTCLALFLCAYILKLKGYRIVRVTQEEVSEKDKEEAKRRIEAFDKLMNYTLDQALQRRESR